MSFTNYVDNKGRWIQGKQTLFDKSINQFKTRNNLLRRYFLAPPGQQKRITF